MRTVRSLLVAVPLLLPGCAGRGDPPPDAPGDTAGPDDTSPDDSGPPDDSDPPDDTDDTAPPDDTGVDPDAPECGDGVAEGDEACDDGNTADVDGCLGDCSAISACGDAPFASSVLDLFPDSGAPIQPGPWTLAVSHDHSAGTTWEGLDERDVFEARLTHAGDTDWELRIGKGSQIYSLRTGAGELVPEQRAGDAEWVDEVIQTVLVNTDLDDPSSESTKYQIHQAGTYRRDADYDITFYSPLLEEAVDAETSRIATMVWPQQAHVPSNYRSRVTLAQQVRDLGAGVIEVTQVFTNFGDEALDYLAVPWLPLRNSVVPVQVASLPGDAGVEVRQGDWCGSCDIPLLEATETSGWFAHLAVEGDCVDAGTCALTGAEPGIALVFGLDDSLWYRWGTHPTRDLTVSTAMRLVTIAPQTSWTLRYFLIVGTLDEMRTLAPQYRDFATLAERPLPAVETPVTPLCAATNDAGQSVLSAACDGEAPVAQAFRAPVDRSLPLFAMTDLATGRALLSVDPYANTERPHDGSTRYDGLLGWGPLDADDACYESVPAASIATDASYFPVTTADAAAVRLRTSAGLTCACP